MTLAIASKLPIKAGQSGAAVKEAQTVLAARGYPLMGTGYFGPKTKDAVATYQKIRGLKSTGIIDMATAVSLDQPTPVPATPADDQSAKTVPPWLTTAIRSIGIAEVKGKGDNPVIIAMAKTCGGNIAKTYKHDDIPWCKMFTEFCLVENGFKGIDTLWALDNVKVGTKLKGPAVGAIASKKRTGGGHTFFVIGKDKKGNIVGVGGNQSDRVSRATFPPSQIVSYNWPDGYPLPDKTTIAALPIVDSAPLSKNEA